MGGQTLPVVSMLTIVLGSAQCFPLGWDSFVRIVASIGLSPSLGGKRRVDSGLCEYL